MLYITLEINVFILFSCKLLDTYRAENRNKVKCIDLTTSHGCESAVIIEYVIIGIYILFVLGNILGHTSPTELVYIVFRVIERKHSELMSTVLSQLFSRNK